MHEIEIINFDNLEVASPPEKRVRTEISATTSKIMARNARKPSDSRRLSLGSETGAVLTLATANDSKKKTKKQKRGQDRTKN